MNPGFTAPPSKDFTSFAGLMDDESGHFGELSKWSGKECADADGLDGLLVVPVQEITPHIAKPFTDILNHCKSGMTGMSGKVKETRDDYAKTDHANASSFAGIYGQPLPGFPDISEVPGLEHLGDFTDEKPSLKEPDPAGDDTAKDIEKRLTEITKLPASAFKGLSGPKGQSIPNIGGYVLQIGEKLYKLVTGQSLIAQLIYPVVGNYGRMKYLEDAYDALGDGIYTVAGTMRKGAVRLGGEWEGQCGTAFDSLMFQWSMGAGGVGDAAKIVSKVYKDGYTDVSRLVLAGLTEVSHLINNELKQLVEEVVGDVGVEAVGGGPEDPVADVAAVLWSIYKDYKIILAIIRTVEAIIKIYNKIKDAVQKIKTDINNVIDLFNKGINVKQAVGSLIDDVKQRGFEFEKSGHWDPNAGVARIALLPK